MKKYVVNAMGMHSSKYGGLEKFQVFLSKELSNKGYGLIVIYNSKPHSEEFIRDLQKSGAILIVSHAFRAIPYLITFVKLFLKYRPSIVHAHFQNYFSIVFAKLMGCRNIITTIHVMEVDKNLNYIQDRHCIPIRTRFFRWIIYSSSNRVLAVSNAVNDQLSRLFPEVALKIETIYLGTMPNDYLSEDIEIDRVDVNKVVIGTIGFNSPIKGLDILMDAMVLLKKKYKIFNFIVNQIGIDPDDPANEEFINLCHQKDLDGFLHWSGICNDVPKLLPGMDIYCQPSRSEALPLSIMEAGMAGLPIVGSRVGGIPEIVQSGKNGYVFDNEDAFQLADYLQTLIQDSKLRQNMGEKSKELIMKHFNIKSQAASICKIYISGIK